MGSLLKQNAFLVRKNLLFWLILAVLFAGSAWAAADYYSEFGMTPGLGIVYAFFCAVYLGDSGASGRLQHNVTTGFSRTSIYFANFLTLLLCCILMVSAAILGDLAGTAIAGRIAVYEPQRILLLFLSLCLNAAGYAGIFTLVCLLMTGRRSGRGTLMLIICCSVFIAVAIWGGNIDNALWEPEMLTYYDAPITEGIDADLIDVYYPDDPEESVLDGLVSHQEPNPAYISEPLRSRYETISEFLPVTQSLRMLQLLASSEEPEPLLPETYAAMYTLWGYAGILAICASGAGVLLFRRRDLT